jgi:beta-galactosidase
VKNYERQAVINSFRFLTLVLLVLFTSRAAGAADSPRQVIDLNPGWKFIREDVEKAEQPATDDSAWTSINLPHTWNNLDGEDGGNNYHRGIGWYRLHLKTDPAWAGKEIYIKFDAASINTDVFVNGKSAGHHSGCFGAFCFDITSLLNPSGDNLIAVKVNNAHDNNVAPLSGDFTVFGGIYRGVHLIVTNTLAISPIDDASSGVYIRQDKIDAALAQVTVTAVVRNAGTARRMVRLWGQILDPSSGNQNTAGTFVESKTPVEAGGSQGITWTFALPHPHLWNARKDPYLYSARVSVMDGESILDVVEQPVGFRFFKVDPEKGFFLNGQPYRLVGVNRHQDHLDEGWAISLADHQLDFANMMEMGCTGVRLSHYQHAQEFYDLCDHGGIVAWAELPLVNEVRAAPEFDANASQQLRELIKQSFNHPAICFWSLSNELRGAGGKTEAQKKMTEHEVELITKLNAEAHELDPTRLTTQASAIQPGKPQDGITDVVAFNRYHGWYGGKPDGLAPDLDKIHATYPNRAVGISEFGAGAAITQHEANVKQPKPGAKWHPEEWQCVVHEAAWAAIKPRTWIWGTFIWAEHDFAADQRNEGDHAGRNDKGMTTYDGKTKKDAFYFYKSNWSQEPTVYITDRRFTPRPVADGPVKIYSNCDSVTLSVNGKSLGPVTGSDIHVFIWPEVKLQPGENTLQATGTRDGKEYTDTCKITVDPNAKDGHPPATEPATKPAG